MAMFYDEKIFAKYRAKAITDIKNLVIGNRYWTNDSLNKSFVLKELISWPELNRRMGYTDYCDKSADIAWMITDTNDNYSLHDNNIGASYNPWLIFDNKSDALACIKELKINIESDEFYDYDCSYYDHSEY